MSDVIDKASFISNKDDSKFNLNHNHGASSSHSENIMKFDNIILLCEKTQRDVLSLPLNPNYSSLMLEKLSMKMSTKQQFYESLKRLWEILLLVKDQVTLFLEFGPRYDSKLGVKANGYRSFLSINCKVIDKITGLLIKMQSDRQISPQNVYLSFKSEFEYWIEYLDKLSKVNSYLVELQRLSNEGQYHLFPDVLDLKSNPTIESIAEAVALEDVSIFFDRGGGFHVHEEVQPTVKFLIGFEALLSDIPYFSTNSLVDNLYSFASSYLGLKYLYDFEYLGKRILANARDQQVTFCKRFFNASELPIADMVMVLGTPSISTNTLISLPPKRIIIEDKEDKLFEVPIPESHLGHQNLKVRFLSSFRTKSMIGNCSCITRHIGRCTCNKKLSTKSRSIIFHAHGGAFVAQTSKSHQTYLNHWAKETGIPILSVDYSLAPEAPYPRAAEEMFYAYCWMRDNFEMLGTTGENVIFAGDSAGANFVLGVTLQCIRHNLPGPNNLCLFYPAMIVQTFPSPSRLISLLDPLGMFPFLLRCMNSYTDSEYMKSFPRTYEEELEKCIENPTRDPLISPMFASQDTISQFPRTSLFSSTIDTCLDESIEFSNKLVDAGVPVSLHVFQDLPHGFLSLNSSSKECQKAVNVISDQLKVLGI